MGFEEPEVIEVNDESFQNTSLELVELSSSSVGDPEERSVKGDDANVVTETHRERVGGIPHDTPSSPFMRNWTDDAKGEDTFKRTREEEVASLIETAKKARTDQEQENGARVTINDSFLNLSNWISETDELASESHAKLDADYFPSQKSIFDKETTSDLISSVGMDRKDGSSRKSQFLSSDPLSESSFISLSPKKRSSTEGPSKPAPKGKSKAKKKTNESVQYKRELREANKVTRKKEDLLGEMKVIFSKKLYNNFEVDYLEKVFDTAQIDFVWSDLPVVYWIRKTRAVYDAKTDIFVPCKPTEIKEKNLVLYYKAKDFMQKVSDGELRSDIKHSLKLSGTQLGPDNKVILVVEGYDQYLLKLKNLEDKKYKDTVMQKFNPEDTRSQRKKADDGMLNITAKKLESMIYKAQVDCKINIFPVRNNKEAIEWLLSFTYTIASSIYDKFQRNHSLSNLGNVKSGSDVKSTFIQAIRQFKLMTEPRAEKLYCSHGSIYSLYKKFQESNSLGVDAAGRNVVPPTADAAMKKFFTSSDPNEIIHD